MGYTQPLFNVRKVAGGYQIYPNGVTTDDLTISPNDVDTCASIILSGIGGITLQPQALSKIYFCNGTNPVIEASWDGTNYIFENIQNGAHIFLKTTGTGKIGFGTYAATGDVACNGNIAIVDAAGNARKLMTTA